MAAGTQPSEIIRCSDEIIELEIEIDPVGVTRLTRLAAAPWPAQPPAQRPAATAVAPGGIPLVDVVLAGEGRAWSGSRYCESVAGRRMRYRGHQRSRPAQETTAQEATAQEATAQGAAWSQVRVDLADPVTGLRAEVFYRILEGSGAFRSWVHLANEGPAPVTVESVTSFLCGGLGDGAGPDDLDELDVLWGENDWLAEGRWQRRPLRDALPDLSRGAHGADPRGRFGVTSAGTWSSGALPADGRHHQPGDRPDVGLAGRAQRRLALAGGRVHAPPVRPRGDRRDRAPGRAGRGNRSLRRRPRADRLRAPLARHAGAGRDVHARCRPPSPSVPTDWTAPWPGSPATGAPSGGRTPDHQRLPVIFNDYMNTLMGDPTTERLLPLITAAASVGAEYFCVDAGWYAEPGESWWDTVGAWKPSPTRFSGGLGEVLEHIRTAGMTPGLWLEPEVVGVRSPVATQLPAEAFFVRHGQRVVENGRYHLDLRHPAAVKHLDEVVDYVVGDLGAGYLKLDYNINGGPGTEAGNVSAGAGLLACNRAHLEWLDAVLDRHPGLVIENCASGGMRMDYAMLARLQLQSTSDQQDFLRYPPITAAAPAAVTPEQAATWAYPQPGFSDREIAFTLCGALLGRVHLSGHIDQMSARQQRLVADAVDVYKRIRADLAGALPFWPLGLPGWADSWLALGMRAATAAYVIAWRRGPAVGPRGGPAGTDPAEMALRVDCLRRPPATAEVLYPRAGQPPVSWDPGRGELSIVLPATPAACLVRIAAG